MGGVIFFAVLVYFLTKRFGTARSEPERSYGGPCGLVWLLCFLILAIANAFHQIAAAILAVAIGIFLLPFLWSWMLAYFGRYKLAYYIGRMCLYYFREDPFSGALYRGFLGANRLGNSKKKREALQWLQTRYLNYKGHLYSGSMTMIVIIEASIESPGDADELATRLRLLQGVGRRSIPGRIGLFASKLALGPALASGDWGRINAVAEQWDTPTVNPIARYLRSYYERYISGSGRVGRLRFFCSRLRVYRYRSLYTLPSDLSVDSSEVSPEVAGSMIAFWQSKHELKTKWDGSAREAYLNAHAREKWTKRAHELGIWQKDRAWETLNASIQKEVGADEIDLSDDALFEKMDRQYKHVNYLAAAVERRLQEKRKSTGGQDFIDWMRILQCFNEMQDNRYQRGQAFNSNHHLVWRWMAELWNKRKQQSLAYFMCVACLPLTEDAGCKELRDVMLGVVAG